MAPMFYFQFNCLPKTFFLRVNERNSGSDIGRDDFFCLFFHEKVLQNVHSERINSR